VAKPATFRDVLFLPGPTQAEGLVRIDYLSDNGTRDALTLYFLEAMLLLRRLEEVRQCARFEFPTDQHDD
jgi:hypothetical protein